MSEDGAKRPPPPPPPAAPQAPPPPPPAAPQAPPPAPPSKTKPDSKNKTKTNQKPKRQPKKRPKGRPKGKKRKPNPKKGKPGTPPITKKKGRRIKIKLGLRAKKLSEDTDSYSDQIGWTTSSSETTLSDFDEVEETISKEPETITHHCTMCGSRMEIPRPKRERYKVICAHPECGHEDQIGF